MQDLVKKKLINFIKTKFILDNRFVFLFFVIIVFVLFRQLFSSYFEADEWPAFTLTLPLTADPLGFLKVFVSGDTGVNIFQIQHIAPISKEVFFLSTLFFGTNFAPYAFISLLLHTLNTFLVFIFIKQLLPRRSLFAFLGALFFSILPTQMHAITWAAVYPSTLLPVTLALLSIIFLRLAFVKENKKFIYFSIIFLFLSIFTKETTAFLFFLLPLMALIEKRVFSFKFLSKIFIVSLVFYSVIRFLIPGIYNFENKIQDHPKDTGTIVSRDLSIYKDLPREVLLRTFIFPLRMTGTLFLPRETTFSILQFITPIIVPFKSIDPSLNYDGSVIFLLIYIAALAILIFCISLILDFLKRKKLMEAQAIAIGLAIIIFGALPLVAIIFTFPRWGYDYYFDSRYYYGSSIGAAIIFPFLLFGFGEFVSKLFKIKSIPTVVSVLFLIWLVNNMYIFERTKDSLVNVSGFQRKEIINQLKIHLPVLQKKTVFYFETNGQSAFGSSLPFYTSVPQALTVVYYDKTPLPNSFYSKPLFDGKPQGYSFSQGRGFGYYTSKKDLSEALAANLFSVDDIYGFYFYADKTKLKDITFQLREEMRDYLGKTDISQWKSFEDSTLKIKFRYPKSSSIKEISDTTPNIIKSLLINDPKFNVTVSFMSVSPSFDLREGFNVIDTGQSAITDKNVSFDKYRSGKVTLVSNNNPTYFMRLNYSLLKAEPSDNSPESSLLIERILGSVENL